MGCKSVPFTVRFETDDTATISETQIRTDDEF